MEEKIKKMNIVFTSLKIPDIIKDLPEFNGTKNTLHEFINNVDEIIENCVELLGEGQTPKTFLRAIRNKITGKANEVLISYGTTTDWMEIKTNLTTHYSDKRTETTLIRDLHKLYQNTDTVEQYYSKIIQIQSAIINIVRIKGEDTAVKEKLYKEMCLAQFISSLKEPLGSTIRSRDPDTIARAFEMCITEQNMYYIKQSNIQSQVRNNWQQRPTLGNSNFRPFPFKPQHNPQLNQYNQNWVNNQNTQSQMIRKPQIDIKNIKQEPGTSHRPTNSNLKNQRLYNIQTDEYAKYDDEPDQQKELDLSDRPLDNEELYLEETLQQTEFFSRNSLGNSMHITDYHL